MPSLDSLILHPKTCNKILSRLNYNPISELSLSIFIITVEFYVLIKDNVIHLHTYKE
jgi:hypothetical protein